MILKLFNQKLKPLENLNKKDKGFRVSVGLKMMLGVGLISILCTGLLVYFTFQVFSHIDKETQILMDVNASMNKLDICYKEHSTTGIRMVTNFPSLATGQNK